MKQKQRWSREYRLKGGVGALLEKYTTATETLRKRTEK